MATRTAKLYQGEDMTPVLDYTDQVIWEESEFGTRAWMGEGNASTVVIRDPLGEHGNEASLPAGLTAKSLASKNLFVIQLGTDYMFRGRVGIKNYSRDSQHVERYRQVECSLHDTNWDLDHIFVHDYVRPSETDIARAQGVIASYLSGFPRESTAINGSNFLSGSNTVSLPANTYTQTSPLGILREVAVTANKQFFVTGDSITGGSLFWDGNDSTVYRAGLRISDRITEIDTTLPCTETSAGIVASGRIIEGFGAGGFTLPAGLSNSMLVVFINKSSLDVPFSATWTVSGSPQVLTAVPSSLIVHSTNNPLGWASAMQAFYLLNPAPANPGQGALSGNGWKGYFVLENVDQSNPFASVVTAEGSDSTAELSIATGAGRIYLNGISLNEPDHGAAAAPVPASGQTQAYSATDVTIEHAGGSGDATPSWTLFENSLWVGVGLAVNGGASESETPTFPPIWNVGPSSTEDGSEQLCEVRLFYGTGTDAYVTAHSLTVHNLYGHSSETFTDDTIATEAEAQTKANSILSHRSQEDKTYNVTVGPLTDEQVLCVKHGQTIQVKARAIPDADDTFRTMRIAQCRYTTPIVGIWFAHLQLGRPWKMEPYSKGPPLAPKAAGSGDTPEPLGLAGDPGTDTGTFANDDHTHGHGTFGTNDLHTEYVREAILTTAGDLPYASATSVWSRLAIGGSNTHLISDGVSPLWRPQAAGGGSALTVKETDGSPSVASVDTIAFTGLTVTDDGSGDVTVSLPAGTSSKASASADYTPTTTTATDVTGATLSLTAGTYIVAGVFDVTRNGITNDRTFEGILDVGGTDENDLAVLSVPISATVRAHAPQTWRITLGSTTTVKLQARHSGGSAGDFTVNAANTTLTAWIPAGAGAGAATKYDPDNTPATTPAVSDEFDNGSLDGAWGWDSTPATVDETTYPGFLFINGDTTERHLGRAWVPGAVDITVAAKLMMTEIPGGDPSWGFGIYVGDTTGNPANTVIWQLESSGSFAAVNENGAGTFVNIFTSAVLMPPLEQGAFYLMMQRTNTGPVWRFYWSLTGLPGTWHRYTTTGSKSLTIGAVGIRASHDGQWAVDWIRAWDSLVTKVGGP